jgi:MOSC domain-containing protein YiiM
MPTLAELLAGPVGPGIVVWIGLRPARRAPVAVFEAAELVAGRGIEGDRAAARAGREGNRQVTLLAAEHLAAIGGFLGREPVAPEALRRNVVVRGANLLALKGRRFRLGTALLEWSGDCHPCSRLEETLGPGGYNAVRGHGGITARVLEGGTLRRGDGLVTV